MKRIAASATTGVAAWCSLGTVGLVHSSSTITRLTLVPRWWLLPVFIASAFVITRVARLTSHQLSALFLSALAILPWLPMPLPAAFLVWTGPLLVAVWSGVLLGVIVAGGWKPSSRWIVEPQRARLLAGGLALTLYVVSAWWLSIIPPSGDAPHYLVITQSLIRDGDVRIENNHQRGDYLEYYPGALEPHYLRRGKNNEIYSIHAPGLPALIAPAYFLAGLPGATLFLALVGAIGAAGMWQLGHRITGSAGAAWFGWAAVALTAPFFIVVSEIFPDGIAATLVLLGMVPLLDPGIDRRSWRVWFAAGVSLAILPWLGSRLVAIAVTAGVLLVLRMRNLTEAPDLKVGPTSAGERQSYVGPSFSSGAWQSNVGPTFPPPLANNRASYGGPAEALAKTGRSRVFTRLLSVALPGIVSAALWFGYFYAIYGTVNPSAPYGPYTQMEAANLVRSIPGLLFDEQFGLISNAPVYGFILAGVIVSAVKRRRWAIELLVVSVPYMIAVGMWAIWWAGTSSPSRYWTPLSLLLGVAAARLWNEARAPATQSLAFAALVVSVLVTVALVGPGRGSLLFNFRDGVALWLEWASDLVDLPRGAPSAFRDSAIGMWLKAAIWSACLGAAWTASGAIGARRPRALVLATPWTLAVAVMLALSLSWRAGNAQPLTPETATLGLLRHVSPLRSTALDYSERRIEAASAALSQVRLRTSNRRSLARPAPLLSLTNLPAGMYWVHVAATESDGGTLLLRAGSSLPLRTWTVPDDGSTALEPPINLAAGVQSLTIDGDQAARRSITAVELQPVVDNVPARADRPVARLAVRYGEVDAYFLDDHAFAEPTGFWLAGGQKAELLIANAGSPLHLFLRNAPVANTVTIEPGAHIVELGPGEEKTLDLTAGSGPALVRIHVPHGFRPWERDHSNADMRYLGCWIEIR